MLTKLPFTYSSLQSCCPLLNYTVGDRLLGDRLNLPAIVGIHNIDGNIIERRKCNGGELRVHKRPVDAYLEWAAASLAAGDNRLRTIGPDALLQLVALRFEIAFAAKRVRIYGVMLLGWCCREQELQVDRNFFYQYSMSTFGVGDIRLYCYYFAMMFNLLQE